MTTATRSYLWQNDTSPHLNAWVTEVGATLSAVGLTQTGDTGQINATTPGLTASVNSNNLYGYQIWQFTDTLAASAPIRIKVEYLNGSNASAPRVRLTVSTTTDGAGNLTGPTFQVDFNSSAAPSGSAVYSYACHTDGTFCLVLGKGLFTSGWGSNNSMMTLVVDRQRDTAGVAQSTGFLCESPASIGGSQTQCRHIYGTNPPGTSSNGVPGMVPDPNATTSTESTNVYVFRHYMMTPGVHPSLGSLTYLINDFTDVTPVTVTMLGASHTFLPVSSGAQYWSRSNSIAHAGMIRWE